MLLTPSLLGGPILRSEQCRRRNLALRTHTAQTSTVRPRCPFNRSTQDITALARGAPSISLQLLAALCRRAAAVLRYRIITSLTTSMPSYGKCCSIPNHASFAEQSLAESFFSTIVVYTPDVSGRGCGMRLEHVRCHRRVGPLSAFGSRSASRYPHSEVLFPWWTLLGLQVDCGTSSNTMAPP